MPSADVSRRDLLKMAGLAAAGSAVGLAGLSAVTPAEAVSPMPHQDHDQVAEHQWFYLIDLRLCDGCEKCTKACRQMHYLSDDKSWIKVYKMTSTTGQEYFMPRVCQQCENAPCVRACPVGASFKSADGITLVDQDLCIGCRMCMAACPYEARYFNWVEQSIAVPSTEPAPSPEWPVPQQKGTVGKCVLCVHNMRQGVLPACVAECDMEALYVGDLNLDLATNGRRTVKFSEFVKENHVIRFKEELNTRPRTFYVLGHGEHLEY